MWPCTRISMPYLQADGRRQGKRKKLNIPQGQRQLGSCSYYIHCTESALGHYIGKMRQDTEAKHICPTSCHLVLTLQ